MFASCFLPSLSILSACLSSPQGKSANEISYVKSELLETEPTVKEWRAFGYIQSYFLSFLLALNQNYSTAYRFLPEQWG